MADEPKAPEGQEPQGQPIQQAPAMPEAGKAPETQAAPLEGKLAGKSPDELAKMYLELEKKSGETSNEIGELRKFREQMDVVLQAIWADQDLYSNVDKKIKEMRGLPAETTPETDGQTQPAPQAPSVDQDTRRALEAQLINDFEVKYGIDKLPADQRREMHTKIGTALAEMLDPGGNKSYQEILAGVSLQRLPRYLENAYFLSNRDKLEANLSSLTASRENEGAAIGSLPSSSGRTSDISLTPSEKETAKKLGVAEDKYLERKKEIAQIQAKGE